MLGPPEEPKEQPELQGANTDGDEESFLSLPDIGEKLGLGPKAFRSLLDTYSDLLTVHDRESDRVMSAGDVDLLQEIYNLTLQGHTETEIRSLIGGGAGAEEAAASQDPDLDIEDYVSRGDTAAEEKLLDALDSLQERLKRSEKRRVEDRDKLMLLLLRTQRELRQLRYELAQEKGRRRKSLLERIFGS